MTELRLHDNELEYYDENGLIEFVGDELIAKTYAQGKALAESLFTESDFADKYINSQSNIDVLIHVARKLNRHNPRPDALTKTRLLEAYRTADAAGGQCGDAGVLEKLLPQVKETSTQPRDQAGRFQNPYLQELDAMLSNPDLPASAITERMRVDAKFREAVEASGRPASAPRETVSPETTARVRSFVAAYRAAPSLRFLGGYVNVGDRPYTRPELDAAVEEASRLGLL